SHAHAAASERHELVVAGEETKPDERARQHGDGRDLRDDERDAVEEGFDDRPDAHAAAQEVVEAIEEVGDHVDRDEGGERQRKGAQELDDQMAGDGREEEAALRHVPTPRRTRPMRVQSRRASPTRTSRGLAMSGASRPARWNSTMPIEPRRMFGSQSPKPGGTRPCSAKACPIESRM